MDDIFNLITGEYPDSIKCDSCGREETNYYEIKEHIDSGERTFECSSCRGKSLFGLIF